jgi:hypothetical protein
VFPRTLPFSIYIYPKFPDKPSPCGVPLQKGLAAVDGDPDEPGDMVRIAEIAQWIIYLLYAF